MFTFLSQNVGAGLNNPAVLLPGTGLKLSGISSQNSTGGGISQSQFRDLLSQLSTGKVESAGPQANAKAPAGIFLSPKFLRQLGEIISGPAQNRQSAGNSVPDKLLQNILVATPTEEKLLLQSYHIELLGNAGNDASLAEPAGNVFGQTSSTQTEFRVRIEIPEGETPNYTKNSNRQTATGDKPEAAVFPSQIMLILETPAGQQVCSLVLNSGQQTTIAPGQLSETQSDPVSSQTENHPPSPQTRNETVLQTSATEVPATKSAAMTNVNSQLPETATSKNTLEKEGGNNPAANVQKSAAGFTGRVITPEISATNPLQDLPVTRPANPSLTTNQVSYPKSAYTMGRSGLSQAISQNALETGIPASSSPDASDLHSATTINNHVLKNLLGSGDTSGFPGETQVYRGEGPAANQNLISTLSGLQPVPEPGNTPVFRDSATSVQALIARTSPSPDFSPDSVGNVSRSPQMSTDHSAPTTSNLPSKMILILGSNEYPPAISESSNGPVNSILSMMKDGDSAVFQMPTQTSALDGGPGNSQFFNTLPYVGKSIAGNLATDQVNSMIGKFPVVSQLENPLWEENPVLSYPSGSKSGPNPPVPEGAAQWKMPGYFQVATGQEAGQFDLHQASVTFPENQNTILNHFSEKAQSGLAAPDGKPAEIPASAKVRGENMPEQPESTQISSTPETGELGKPQTWKSVFGDRDIIRYLLSNQRQSPFTPSSGRSVATQTYMEAGPEDVPQSQTPSQNEERGTADSTTNAPQRTTFSKTEMAPGLGSKLNSAMPGFANAEIVANKTWEVQQKATVNGAQESDMQYEHKPDQPKHTKTSGASHASNSMNLQNAVREAGEMWKTDQMMPAKNEAGAAPRQNLQVSKENAHSAPSQAGQQEQGMQQGQDATPEYDRTTNHIERYSDSSSSGENFGNRLGAITATGKDPVFIGAKAASGATTTAQTPNPAELISSLVRQFQMAVKNNSREITLQLRPEHLGLVRIRLKMKDDRLSGKVEVSSPEIQQLLHRHSQDLTHRLQEMHINLDHLEFDLLNNGSGGGKERGPAAGNNLGTAGALDGGAAMETGDKPDEKMQKNLMYTNSTFEYIA